MMLVSPKRVTRNVGTTPRVFLLALSTLTLAIVTMTTMTRTANGYEISIYAAYSEIYWTMVCISMIAAAIMLIQATMSRLPRIWMAVTWANLGIINACLLFVPRIRGYTAYGRGDVLTHIGLMFDIQSTGAIGTNIYPTTHVLGTAISQVCSFSLWDIASTIPAWFAMLFVLFMYTFGRTVLPSGQWIALLLGLSSILLLSYRTLSFAPFIQSVQLCPLILYLFIKNRSVKDSRFSGMLILLIALTVTFHPITGLALTVLFTMHRAELTMNPNDAVSRDRWPRRSLTIAGVTLVLFFAWQSYGIATDIGVRSVIERLLGLESPSEFQLYGGAPAAASLSILTALGVLVSRYALLASMTVITLLVMLANVLTSRRTRSQTDRTYLFSLSYLSRSFLLFLFVGILAFFSSYVVEFDRLLIVGVPLAAVLIAFGVWNTGRNLTPYRASLRRLTISVFIIGTLTILSVHSIFPSPRTTNINQQVTEGELTNMELLFQTRNSDFLILEWGIDQERFFDAIYGAAADRQNIRYGSHLTSPLDHFGYNSTSHVGSNYDESTYLVITTMGRQYYEALFPDAPTTWRFAPEDFEKLEWDHSVNHIASFGDADTYLVTPIRVDDS